MNLSLSLLKLRPTKLLSGGVSIVNTMDSTIPGAGGFMNLIDAGRVHHWT